MSLTERCFSEIRFQKSDQVRQRSIFLSDSEDANKGKYFQIDLKIDSCICICILFQFESILNILNFSH